MREVGVFGSAVQLLWDERSIEADVERGRVSLLIPARFSKVVVWWRFRRSLESWSNFEEGDVAQLDPDWVQALSERKAPSELMLLVAVDLLDDDGYRSRHALHELAIFVDKATRDLG